MVVSFLSPEEKEILLKAVGLLEEFLRFWRLWVIRVCVEIWRRL